MNAKFVYLNVMDQGTRWNQIMADAFNHHNKFSLAMSKTIETVSELENCFSLLNAQLGLISPTNSFFYRSGADAALDNMGGINRDDSDEEILVGNEARQKNRRADVGQPILDIVDKIVMLGDEAIKDGAAFGEFPPAVNSLKNALGIIGDIGEGGNGITTLCSVSTKGVAFVEAVSNAGEIMAGGGVSEAGAAFGLPGSDVGTGPLILCGIRAIAASQKVEKSYDPKDFTIDKWKKYYRDKELNDDFEKLIELYHPKNYKQLDAIEEELNADFFVQDRLRRIDSDLKAESYEVYEYGHKKVLYNPTSYVAVSERPGIADANIWDVSWKNGRFDQQLLAEMPAKNNEIYQFANVAAKPKLIHESTIRLPTNEEWDVAPKENNKIPTKPASKNRHIQHSKQSFSRKLNSSTISGDRPIININKPMIENFIMNTKELNEGLNDFKRKVEEVLLEILNSANVIQ